MCDLKTYAIGSDPLIVGFGEWIPDRTGALVWTGEGPLLPKGCFILQTSEQTRAIILGNQVSRSEILLKYEEFINLSFPFDIFQPAIAIKT